MSTEDVDYLSSCISLSNIISYLEYSEVVCCMQVNKKMNNCINRHWDIMQREDIKLKVVKRTCSINNEDELCLRLYKCSTRLSEVTFTDRKWSCGLANPVPFLKKVIETNSLPQSDDGAFEMKPEIDGLKLLLRVLLPRVCIYVMDITMLGDPLAEDNTMETLLECLLENYSSTKQCELTIHGTYYPVFQEIARAVGSEEIRLELSEDSVLRLSDLDTGKMKISVDKSNISVHDLIAEWKAGQRDIVHVELANCEEQWVYWDVICSELGVTPKKSDGRKESNFQLHRQVDNAVLDVSYTDMFLYSSEVNIRQL